MWWNTLRRSDNWQYKIHIYYYVHCSICKWSFLASAQLYLSFYDYDHLLRVLCIHTKVNRSQSAIMWHERWRECNKCKNYYMQRKKINRLLTLFVIYIFCGSVRCGICMVWMFFFVLFALFTSKKSIKTKISWHFFHTEIL